MAHWKLIATLSVIAIGAILAFGTGALGQPPVQTPMAQMMNPQMPMRPSMTTQQMNQMMRRMQRQMARMNQMRMQMDAQIKALREPLNKVNPDLLTGQERPLYEYLKLMQAHMETMPPMMRSMQDTMQEMMPMMMPMPGRSR